LVVIKKRNVKIRTLELKPKREALERALQLGERRCYIGIIIKNVDFS
jgi:hypothetical protein